MKTKIQWIAALAVATFFTVAGTTAHAWSPGEHSLTVALLEQGGDKTTTQEKTNPDGSKTTTETTTDKNGNTAKTETTQNKDGSTTKKTTEHKTDKNGTKQVKETERKDGKVVRERVETTGANGEYKEEVLDREKKTKTESTGQKSGDVKIREDTTEVDSKGNVKRTKTERNPDGSTKKVDEVSADGKKTTSSTEYKDGKPTKKTEYDDQGRKTSETEYGGDGKPTKKTEYDKSGKVKTTEETAKDGTRTRTEWKNDNKDTEVVEHPDGSRTVTEYKNGKPVKTTEYDKKGKPVKSYGYDRNGEPVMQNVPMPGPDSAVLQGMIVAAPDAFVPGESLTFSASKNIEGLVVTTGDGTVLEARPIVGELWGVVVPAEAKTLHIRAGDVVVGALAVAAVTSHGGSTRPQLQDVSPFAAPGDVITLHGRQFDPRAGDNLVTINGLPATVLAASPVSLTAIMPEGVTPGHAQIRVRSNGQESNPIAMTSVNLQWDPASGTMTIGQKARRILRVVGTDQPVQVLIQDPASDSAEVPGKGLRLSAGGENNVVPIDIVPLRLGSYSVKATVAEGASQAEQDRRNGEASGRDRDSWNSSARNDTNAQRAQEKRNAAANAHKASQNWDAAAKARDKGLDTLAKNLEEAAKLRDKAANEWGANGDKAAAEKAEKAAAALEK